MLSYEIHARTFHFKQPAGTSRGVYTVRKSYFVTLHDSERPQCKGIGECAQLPFELRIDSTAAEAVVRRCREL